MRKREFKLVLEEGAGETLVARIAHSIRTAIQTGRLAPGSALPGSRKLSEELGVTRNTAIAALERLEDEGWLESEASRGTFVALRPPMTNMPVLPASQPGFDLPSQLSPISVISEDLMQIADGVPDARLVPSEALGAAYRRAVLRHGTTLLQDGEPMGNALLRQSLAEWASERFGGVVEPDQVLITRGSRMGLSLLSLGLLRPGDAVGVEEPGNRAAWDTLQQCSQVRLVPLPVDPEGLNVEVLEEKLRDDTLKALYLTPGRQFPTGVTLAPARASALLELAQRHRLALIEDDYDSEFFEGSSRPLPLMAQDRSGQVLHMGSLSRLLAPGLRLGYLIGPPGLAERLARVRRNLDRQGDRVLEWAMADLIRDGELARHLRRARRMYQTRRDFIQQHLKDCLGFDPTAEAPAGGLAIWMNLGQEADTWVEQARKLGLMLNLPSHFHFEKRGQHTRMGYAQMDELEIREAVRRLVLACPYRRADPASVQRG